MGRIRRSSRLSPFAVAAVGLAALVAPLAARDEPSPPTDAEISKFIAIWTALAGDPASAGEACGLTSGDSDDGDWDAAEAGRLLEASPLFGPHLRRNALSGSRFSEVTLQIFGGLLGLAYADELDATARERGLAATNRQRVIRDSAEARVAAQHEAALKPVMERAGAICAAAEEDDVSDDEEE